MSCLTIGVWSPRIGRLLAYGLRGPRCTVAAPNQRRRKSGGTMKRGQSRDVVLLVAFFAVVLLAAAWHAGRLDGAWRSIEKLIG